MSRTVSLIALVVVLALVISGDRFVRAATPTTQPDLAAENALLKKMIAEDAVKSDQLLNKLHEAEDLNAELHVKIRDLEQRLAMRDETPPKLPYRMQPMVPSPFNLNPGQDPDAGSFSYLGKTVYVVPIHDATLSIDPVLRTPANSGVYEMSQGTITVKPAKH